MTDRTRLVVLFGGRSAEHEVSCTSAVSVLQSLDPDRYDVVPVGVTREGRWVLAEEAAKVLAAAGPRALPAALTAEGPAVGPLETVAEAGDAGPTVVFPLLHGPFGEDGTVQGLCELAGVPYVGSGVLGSAVAMDKITAKRLVGEAGLPHARWLRVRDRDADERLVGSVEAALGWPVFVKPSNLGSSVGVSKAHEAGELAPALRLALTYDEWALIEEAVEGREIEVGVLGDPPEASVPGEIRPSREFYDYDDKYREDRAKLLIPAPIEHAISDEVRGLAVKAFRVAGISGMARVDFFLERGTDRVLVNELNTLPGFTAISMYPKLWEASGLPLPQLLDELIRLALERKQKRDRLSHEPPAELT